MPKPSRRLIKKPECLSFSDLHGKGIVLSNNNRVATRSSGFGDAIVFGSRMIRTYEKVFLRHRQKQVDWIGSLRVGYCLNDPKQKFTRETLPNLAFKNLSDVDGFWLRACPDELLRTAEIIYVYYSFDGQIYVGGYGQTAPAQAILTINEHSGPYYLFCEVYGKTDEIEIIDPQTLPDQTLVDNDISRAVRNTVIDTVTKKINSNSNICDLQYFSYLYSANTQPTLTFLSTTKHNVIFTNDNRICCVENLQTRLSYAFVSAPMTLDDVLVCKIMDWDANTSAVLLFGLTTCNPKSLKNQQLPEDTTTLITQNASSKWFIDPDIHMNVSIFDELAFWFDPNGHVYLSVNNQSPTQLKCNLPSSDIANLTLYPFFDMYGQITSLHIYNYMPRNQVNFAVKCNVRGLCLICHENLVNTQFIPCQCMLCSECAATIKRTSLLADCPFDRKHIAQIRPLP